MSRIHEWCSCVFFPKKELTIVFFFFSQQHRKEVTTISDFLHPSPLSCSENLWNPPFSSHLLCMFYSSTQTRQADLFNKEIILAVKCWNMVSGVAQRLKDARPMCSGLEPTMLDLWKRSGSVNFINIITTVLFSETLELFLTPALSSSLGSGSSMTTRVWTPAGSWTGWRWRTWSGLTSGSTLPATAGWARWRETASSSETCWAPWNRRRYRNVRVYAQNVAKIQTQLIGDCH